MDNVFTSVTIVPAGAISPFEWSDCTPETGSETADFSTVVRHPFQVVSDSKGSLVLLDQTRLFLDLVAAGLNYVPVQQCAAESVRLASERLTLTGFGPRDLERLLAAHPDQLVAGTLEAAPFGFVSVTIEFPNGEPVTVYARHSSRLGCPTSLDLLFRAVLAHGQYSLTADPQFQPGTPFRVHHPTAWLTLPEYHLQDLFSAASSGHRFPPGVINARTPYRVFNIDFPISVLASDIPVEEKEIYLRDLILFREQSCRTAYFNGPVYILNR